MNDSILQAPAAPAIDFGYIQGASRRIEAMRSSEADPVEPPTSGVSSRDSGYTDEERSKVEERLQALGYLE